MRSETTPACGSSGKARASHERRILLEPRHQSAALRVELRPPGEVVIAEVEDVRRPRLDRHVFGGADVVDVGGAQRVIDGPAQVRIEDDVGLGAANLGREARPFRSDTGQMQAGSVDQAHRVAQLATKAGRRRLQHRLEQIGENLGVAQPVGVGEGRTLWRLRATVIEPSAVASHRRADLAQRRAAAQLTKQQRLELMPRRELANQVVRPVPLDQFVETRPRNQFQDVVEDAIDMTHGVDPFRVQMSRQTPDTSRINVVRRFKKNEPDSRGSSPAMTAEGFSALNKEPSSLTLGVTPPPPLSPDSPARRSCRQRRRWRRRRCGRRRRAARAVPTRRRGPPPSPCAAAPARRRSSSP